LVEVNVNDDVVFAPASDGVPIVKVNVVAGNTYDPLDPIHSLALLELLLHTKYSPDALFNQIAPLIVGLTVVVGLLAVIYVTVLTVI
jgi:hypothetical protein